MKTYKFQKPIYIIGHGTCLPDDQPQMVNISAENDKQQYLAYVIDGPVAKGMIPAGKLRRLGKIQKMALSSTWKAIDGCSADLTQDDISVAVGTGLGSMNQTVSFLENMFINNEAFPKPACFTNSVHNAVASQIAIIFNCKGENHTFTQNAMSFEIALKYSMTLLQGDRAKYAIACGCDELSGWMLDYGKHMRWWKDAANRLAPMTEPLAPATIPGEGSASYILCNERDRPADRPAVKIVAVDVCNFDPDVNPKTRAEFIINSLTENELQLSDVDQFIFGADGSSSDKTYRDIKVQLDNVSKENIQHSTYKQHCGQFCTASAIGLAKAVDILIDQNPNKQKPQTIVIYNYSPDGFCSLFILQSC
jgi:hypothetical protein